jgi:hypothetical protein
LLAGAVHATVALVSPAVAETPDGVPGTVAGVTAADAGEYMPVPAELIAATRKTYDVPLVRPVTVCVVAVLVWNVLDAEVQCAPLSEEYCTSYPSIAAPPLSAGAVHETVDCALPRVACTPVGAPGALVVPPIVTGVDATEYGPVPAPLIAPMRKMYVPLVRPVTVCVVAVLVWNVLDAEVQCAPLSEEYCTS